MTSGKFFFRIFLIWLKKHIYIATIDEFKLDLKKNDLKIGN